MLSSVGPEARTLRTEDQRNSRRSERLLQVTARVPSKPNPPEAGVPDLLQGAGEVDDPCPGHALKGSRCGLGQRAALRRRMPILGDNADRSERRRRAQDRTDIVR